MAQWSLHRSFKEKTLDPVDFASIAKRDFDINAVEYVNGFYADKKKDNSFWKSMRTRANDNGVSNLLIMVDEEGELGNASASKRKKAVENHKPWVDAAREMGCHSVRVNAFGDSEQNVLRESLIDGLGQLVEYASTMDISILIENHGLHSSNAEFIVEVIEKVNNPALGTLPDFGNWCTGKKWGSIQRGSCEEVYDLYKGVKTFLPFAKGVSAKSYQFDAKGNETLIDYKEMIQLVKASSFTGFIGIEYEGNELPEAEGILATKALLQRLI